MYGMRRRMTREMVSRPASSTALDCLVSTDCSTSRLQGLAYSTTNVMRIGILGARSINDTHPRAGRWIPGVEVVAVHGQNQEKAARLAKEHGARAFDTLDAFLAHPMDIVAIGTPSSLHAAEGSAAAARGLHVLVEK